MDRRHILEYIRRSGFLLPNLFRNDPEIVLTVTKRSSSAFEYASDSLKCNKAFVLEILTIDSSLYGFIDNNSKRDPHVLHTLVNLINKNI